MITSGLLSVLILLLTPIFNLFPSIDLSSVPFNGNLFVTSVRALMILLPVDTITTLFSIQISLGIIRIIISFVKTLWSMIPIL